MKRKLVSLLLALVFTVAHAASVSPGGSGSSGIQGWSNENADFQGWFDSVDVFVNGSFD